MMATVAELEMVMMMATIAVNNDDEYVDGNDSDANRDGYEEGMAMMLLMLMMITKKTQLTFR